MNYQLTENSGCIIRVDDGAFIPVNMENADYQAYEAWLAAGNAPLPAPSESISAQASTARSQRDALLAGCDWTQCSDSPLTDADKAQWATYRTALRNLPAQSGFPGLITWPNVPAATPAPAPSPSPA